MPESEDDVVRIGLRLPVELVRRQPLAEEVRIPVPEVQVLSQTIADAQAPPRLNHRVCARIVRQPGRPCQSGQAIAPQPAGRPSGRPPTKRRIVKASAALTLPSQLTSARPKQPAS